MSRQEEGPPTTTSERLEAGGKARQATRTVGTVGTVRNSF
jgi:hypothetical protein